MLSLWDREQWERRVPPTESYSTAQDADALPAHHGSLHAMLPPSRKPTASRSFMAEDWNIRRYEISKLYEENTLEHVMEIMRERHNLTATYAVIFQSDVHLADQSSAKQYKDRIKKWDLNKNIQPEEMEAMIRKQRQRESEHKSSAFRIRKRPVNPEKINRYMKEHSERVDIIIRNMNMDRKLGEVDQGTEISMCGPGS